MALSPLALATHVNPTFVEGPDNHTCSDFAPEGATWSELKVDPPKDGTSTQGDLTITVDIEGKKVFAWTASSAVVAAVFVKAGSDGHYLYTYDPPSDGDTGLTSPESGSKNQISHISFCIGPAAQEPTCETHPDMDECQEEEPTCETHPDMDECQEEEPTCETHPDMDECQEEEPTCETHPDMDICVDVEVCLAIGLNATANGDGSVTVNVDTEQEYELHAVASDGERTLLGSFDGDATFTDTTVVRGSTMVYVVVVAGVDCATVEVTAIPDFPTTVGLTAAGALGLAGYVFARRRKP